MLRVPTLFRNTAKPVKQAFSTMSFQLSSTQKEFQQVARSFAQNEMMPLAADYDKSGEFPQDIFAKAQ